MAAVYVREDNYPLIVVMHRYGSHAQFAVVKENLERHGSPIMFAVCTSFSSHVGITVVTDHS